MVALFIYCRLNIASFLNSSYHHSSGKPIESKSLWEDKEMQLAFSWCHRCKKDYRDYDLSKSTDKKRKKQRIFLHSIVNHIYLQMIGNKSEIQSDVCNGKACRTLPILFESVVLDVSK